MTIEQKYTYARNVLCSCKTIDQVIIAKKWAVPMFKNNFIFESAIIGVSIGMINALKREN